MGAGTADHEKEVEVIEGPALENEPSDLTNESDTELPEVDITDIANSPNEDGMQDDGSMRAGGEGGLLVSDADVELPEL